MEGLRTLAPAVRPQQGLAPQPAPPLPASDPAAIAAGLGELQAIHRRLPREKLGQSYDNQANSAVFPNEVGQLDLLELPADNGQRYAMLYVDVARRRVGAVPLAAKSSQAIRAGLQQLFLQNPLLRPPSRLEVDGEAAVHNGTANNWLLAQGVYVRRGRPGRTKGQAVVEAYNKLVGSALTTTQQAKELESKRASQPQANREWVAELPYANAELNRQLERSPAELDRRQLAGEGRRQAGVPGQLPPVGEGVSCDVIPVGTQVRLLHERSRPKDVFERPVAGTKRAANPWFSTEPRDVEDTVFTPGQAPRYLLTGLPGISFAREELRRFP